MPIVTSTCDVSRLVLLTSAHALAACMRALRVASNTHTPVNAPVVVYSPMRALLTLCALLQRKLMERNVAEEIAAKVVASVAQSLEGQKLSSFTGGWTKP